MTPRAGRLGGCISASDHWFRGVLDFVELSAADLLPASPAELEQLAAGLPVVAVRRALPKDLNVFSSEPSRLDVYFAALGAACGRHAVRVVGFGSGEARRAPDPGAGAVVHLRQVLLKLRSALQDGGAQLLLVVDGFLLDCAHSAADPYLASFLAAYGSRVKHCHVSGAPHRMPSAADLPGITAFLKHFEQSGSACNVS